MADNQNEVNNLINGLQFQNPKLYSLLQTLANDLYGLDRQINPPTAQSVNLNPSGNVVTVDTPTDFLATIFLNDIRLSWSPTNTNISLYEIKLGNNYTTATVILTTATFSADIDPVSRFILTGASYTFWLTAIDSSGNRSVPATLTVNIPDIGLSVVSTTIVGNNVLLRWTVPSSTFTIAKYNVFRNGIIVGTLQGTFDVIFETVGGSFSYSVQAVDIVGNLGPISALVTVLLGNPTDFTLFSSRTSVLDGVKVNAIIDNLNRLFVVVNTTESWADHFGTRGWASIQAQINAGYTRYFEPGA